ncbi:MAG: phosphate ABC transporter permease PstA [Chloroflexota bacterium]
MAISEEVGNLPVIDEESFDKSGSLDRAKILDKVMTGVMWVAALFLAITMIIVIGLIFYQGVPTLSWDFLTNSSSYSSETPGIGPLIWTTIYVVVLSLVITVPIGIGAAIYLNEYSTGEGRFSNAIRFSIESLASIPSIIFGIFGSILFVRILAMGLSVMAGALTLAVMNLPVTVRLAEDALKGVPESFREGSDALGATKWETIRKVVLPNAFPGFITVMVLTAGRAMGETAPVIMTLGTTISPNAEYSLNRL